MWKCIIRWQASSQHPGFEMVTLIYIACFLGLSTFGLAYTIEIVFKWEEDTCGM